MLKSLLLFSLSTLLRLTAHAGPPQIHFDVAQFRGLDKVEGGAEVEIYVSVPTQPLTYRQRAPKQFQSAATVTLQILKANGQLAFQETVTLRPPTLNDTLIAIKNPVSFLKRVSLPAGRYTLRGRVRDQYRAANGETTVEQPLEVKAPSPAAFLSDIVLLAKPAVKTTGSETFIRGGYLLTRAPSGLYARGASNLYFYTELNQAPAGQAVRLHYHLENPEGFAADADAPLTPQAGRPTSVAGQLPFGPLPDGEFALTIEVYGANKKLLTTQTARGRRDAATYAPAGAAVPR
ncbi:hypothetical protein [uncultured Hymenobacter sp.]|uniref:hypothetical protein n=1 Tax=uncultured Hymenobacter sp. TaxID=170016 RepID=UPI0035CA2045